MRTLILDTTHGGEILAKRYIAKGDEVTCVDVYNVTPEPTMNRVRSYGAMAVSAVPAGEYDLVVMPAHCPDVFLDGCTYGKRIFFSEAVKEFIDDRRFRIEITGVKGKTSTCYLLASILEKSGKKVFLHSSRGQGMFVDGDLNIDRVMSIAPTSLLELPEGDFDAMVCEVSLGGSGKADIAGITNILDNYGIARNSRKASDGKKEILCDKVNIVRKGEVEFWAPYCNMAPVGYGGRIAVIGKPEFGKPLEIEIDYGKKLSVKLSEKYLVLQYIEAMEMAVEICFRMGVDADAVVSALEEFKGVPGRGEIWTEGGVRHVKERNPGISANSVGWTLSALKAMGVLENAFMIVDPVSKKVCDKMKADEISAIAEKYSVLMKLTKGDGIRPEIPPGCETVIEFIKEGFQ